MKYTVAIIACLAECFIYALIGALLGWKHLGGYIPIVIFMGIMGATWRGVTNSNLSARTLPKKRPKRRPSTEDSHKNFSSIARTIRTSTEDFISPKEVSSNTGEHMNADGFFETAYEELTENNFDKAIWARAFSEESGDENRARALYIKLRVERLTSEAHAVQLALKRNKEQAEMASIVEEVTAKHPRIAKCLNDAKHPKITECLNDAIEFKIAHPNEYEAVSDHYRRVTESCIIAELQEKDFSKVYGIIVMEAYQREIEVTLLDGFQV